MNERLKNSIEDIALKARGKRLIKRAMALVCAFCILATGIMLKRSANTLERIATCGFAEHIHSEEACCDEAGNLICGMEEHVHTDACYQTAPGETELTLGEAEDDTPIISEAVDACVAEADALDLGDGEESAEPDFEEEAAVLAFEEEAAEPAFEEEADAPLETAVPVFDLDGRPGVHLSEVLGAAYPDFGVRDIVDVGESIVSEDQPASISVTAEDGDFYIAALRDFIDDDVVEAVLFLRDGGCIA